MLNHGAAPVFSIIISVFNDWVSLETCLRSLAEQSTDSSFEVIIIDDGSKVHAPKSIREWGRFFPLTVLRQPHAGISTARNRGIRVSKATVLLFVDADCRLEKNCLTVLHSAIIDNPANQYFQMRLVGDCATLVGRAEELRLTALQSHLLQVTGYIRYLNTAGFAIRREKVDVENGLFDVTALRAEDTLLLVCLMQNGELPLFVSGAVVQHVIPLTLFECFGKDIRSAGLELRAYEIVAAKGLKIRLTNKERLQLLWSMWTISRRRSIGRRAWFVLTARQALQRSVSLMYKCLPSRPT